MLPRRLRDHALGRYQSGRRGRPLARRGDSEADNEVDHPRDRGSEHSRRRQKELRKRRRYDRPRHQNL